VTNIAPIPANSRMALDIAKIDAAVVAMRSAAQTVPGAASRIYVHDHLRSNRLTTIEQYRAVGEGQYGFDEFYHYWDCEGRSSRRGEEPRISHRSGPHWIRISTPHRLLWVETLPLMLESLRGMPVTVSRSTSWTWDRVNRRPNGEARYVHEFEILLCLSHEVTGFLPEPYVTELLKNVCRADHPLADEYLFHWQIDRFRKSTFTSYGWTAKGVSINFDTKELMEQSLAEMFPGIKHEITRTGKGNGTTWHVELDLCAGAAEVALA
jgi:hypothetical protein